MFEPNEQGGTFVTHDELFTALWYNSRDDELYFTKANDATVYLWDDPAQNPLPMEWKSKTFLLEDYVNFGAARIKADFTVGTSVTFKLWVNKQLVFTHTVTNDLPFRLPTGYRADTFEFGVETNIRLRAIHVAETVSGLKAV